MGPVRLGELLFILAVFGAWAGTPKEEDDATERLPSKCEVCKLLSLELQEELSRTGRSREVLELGQVLDTGKRKRHVPYSVSETRLEEALENLCERILDYSVHAERKGSLRYAKCETMLEEFEDIVGDWYFHHQEQPLQHFLCEGHVLSATETACLQETWTEKEKITDGQEKTEEEEEQEEEEEIKNPPAHLNHDPEDL
ncbi:protein canopy homolog 4 isoform X3 [Dasypus novemcinctus]|uniref:protein canopy homolog 4 isoform X3 n=1 Tax=Dasypus novemcinctus TaxID=9361 RepID=UPI000C85D3B6|nr:protein canopy homolog 4 isoform X3 [Dasypus novemcinctus]